MQKSLGVVDELLQFSVEGRLPRKHYWVGLVFYLLLVLILEHPSWMFATEWMVIIQFALYVLSFIWLIMLVVRRLHDLGYSAWATLFLLVPVVNVLGLIVLGIIGGIRGKNRFGEDPLGREPLTVNLNKAPRSSPTIDSHATTSVNKSKTMPVSEPLDLTELNELPECAKDLIAMTQMQIRGEGVNISLQMKLKAIDKLARLYNNHEITLAVFEQTKRQIMAL